MAIFIIYTLGLAVVTALAAAARNRDPLVWGLLGAFFGIFALLAVLVMNRVEPKSLAPFIPRRHPSERSSLDRLAASGYQSRVHD